MIKAALLDENGVYLGMNELQSPAQLTELHLPQITACDLAPGLYRWIPDERRNARGERLNPHRGAFWPIAWLELVGLYDAPAEGLPQRIEDLRG